MISRPILKYLFQCYIILLLNHCLILDARSLDEQTEVEDTCSPPPNRANSQINLTQEWLPIGTKVNYTCDPGYYLFGNDVRTCQRYNTWSGESPLCMKKVSLGKHVNCTGDLTCGRYPEEGLQWLVDNNDDTCYQLLSSNSQQETFQWTLDLLEEFQQVGALRFVFKSQSGDIPIVDIILENVHKQRVTLTPKQCSIEQKPLNYELSEMIVRPNLMQSARFVHIFIKTKDSVMKTEFCEAEAFAEDAPAIHQCFDPNDIDGTVDSRMSLSNSLTYGSTCYTFNSKDTNTWVTARQTCITKHDGKLADGITPDIKSVLTNFVKAKNMVSHYWIGGKTIRKTVPGLKGSNVIWQWNNGENIDRAVWNPDQEPAENQCLGINAPRGMLLKYSCSSYTGSLCETKIKRCSSPEKGEGVTLKAGSTTHVGATITYSCLEGYTIKGDHTRECQTNGKWSGSAPKCISHRDIDKEKYEMPKGGLIGVIVAGVIVGILIILIVVTVIIVKRRGSFKKTISFKKTENGESVETLDSKEELKSQKCLSETPKENYQSMNSEQQHQEHEMQQQQLE